MKKWKIALTLGIVCCVLTIAISIQFKTINDANSTVSQTLTGNELRDQVLKWKEKYDKASVDLKKSEQKLEETRLKATQNDENALNKEAEIKLDNTVLGLTDVTGSGIVITLKDNNNVKRSNLEPLDNIELYLVHAGDLVEVINALRNAGAEAISINGQRLVNSTAITCIGNVIKINDEKVTSPMTIKAIGLPESLAGIDRLGGYISLLEEKGIVVTIKKSDKIQIPKYTGAISAKYMSLQK